MQPDWLITAYYATGGIGILLVGIVTLLNQVIRRPRPALNVVKREVHGPLESNFEVPDDHLRATSKVEWNIHVF